jgi:hypothetical protein
MTGPTDLPQIPSPRSRSVALALAALLGPFGAHRFYVGKVRSGVLMCATLGGVGIWYLYDLILVSAGSFRDVRGRLVSNWDPEYAAPAPSDALLDEVETLRAEVAELTERVEFAERLLAQPRAGAEPPAYRS